MTHPDWQAYATYRDNYYQSIKENQMTEKLTGNALIVNNLTTLLEAVKAQPEELFNLDGYKEEEACGTLFCTAGLGATLPVLQEQGMFLGIGRWGHWFVFINGKDVDDDGVADDLFGDEAWHNLFAPYGNGECDEELGAYAKLANGRVNWEGKLLTDKQLAISRLERQLNIYKTKGE